MDYDIIIIMTETRVYKNGVEDLLARQEVSKTIRQEKFN